MSFSEHLAGLHHAELAELLRHRVELLVEPAPRSLAELEHRLSSPGSVFAAHLLMNTDETAVVRLTAYLGGATAAELAARLDASEAAVRAVVDGLRRRGLAWWSGERLELQEELAEDFADELHGFRPVAELVQNATPESPRPVTDSAAVIAATARLSPLARAHLHAVMARGARLHNDRAALAELLSSGLVVGPAVDPAVPREVARALMAGEPCRLTGPPVLPAATAPPDSGQAAAEAGLRALTTMLDATGLRPIAMARGGGVGVRELQRLTKKLGVPEAALWIDIAYEAGLLTGTPAGYVATREYDAWRDTDTATRWSRIVLAWHGMEHAPTSRETLERKVPPPLELGSTAGRLRRALLRATAGGWSVPAAAPHVGWLCPFHGYEEVALARKADAAIREATQLGVVVGDRLSELGERLVAAIATGEAAELSGSIGHLLPDTRGSFLLQSDLTAVVVGQPTAVAARLLAATATVESRGTATTWRITPATLRGAFDAGWTAESLRSEFVAASGRELPQPLAYQIADAARVHGAVRVRPATTCITGAEAELEQMLHTRSLAALELRRLAPTVLTSVLPERKVMSGLRAAGFAPLQESAAGEVIVEKREEPWIPSSGRKPLAVRPRVAADELAARLLAGDARPTFTPTHYDLVQQAPQLDDAAIAVLAEALDEHRDLRIQYRGHAAPLTIRPIDRCGEWLRAWCDGRSDRPFALAEILAVSPAGSWPEGPRGVP